MHFTRGIEGILVHQTWVEAFTSSESLHTAAHKLRIPCTHSWPICDTDLCEWHMQAVTSPEKKNP